MTLSDAIADLVNLIAETVENEGLMPDIVGVEAVPCEDDASLVMLFCRSREGHCFASYFDRSSLDAAGEIDPQTIAARARDLPASRVLH